MAKVSNGILKTIRTPYIDKNLRNDTFVSDENDETKNNLKNDIFLNENKKKNENNNDKTTTTISLDKSTNMGKNYL